MGVNGNRGQKTRSIDFVRDEREFKLKNGGRLREDKCRVEWKVYY